MLGLAFSAFGLLANLQDDEFAESLASIEIFSSPKKNVVVTRRFEGLGKFVLLPETTTVTSTAVDKFENKQNKAVIINFEPPLHGFVFTAEPCVAEKNQHPFWHILETTTTNEEEANLTWAKVAVSSLSGFDFLGDHKPPPMKRVTSKQAAPSTGEGKTCEQVVKIPILVNSRALEDVKPITPAKILKDMEKA